MLYGRSEEHTVNLACCPAWYARSPAAKEAERAWRWWSKGQLGLLYPAGIPTCVSEAVEVADETAADFQAEKVRLNQPSDHA